EDGIRDFHVTGVQTCALPIYIAVVDQRVDVAIGDRVDAAAASAVAAVGAAARHVLLPPETDGAVAALAGVHFDTRFVDEFHKGRALCAGNGNKKALSQG